VISKRDWQINFRSGSAEFDATASAELDKLLSDLLVASNTFVEVHGHTDSKGSPDANMRLSESRAFAVKSWLEGRASRQLQGRLKVVSHGQTQPKESNETEPGRAANRRVEIKILAN
jgi:outer membrane protein OmpA-like peptidoglycan-associated protein